MTENEARVARTSSGAVDTLGRRLTNRLRPARAQFNLFFNWPDSRKDDTSFLGSPLQARHRPFIANRPASGFHQTFEGRDVVSLQLIHGHSVSVPPGTPDLDRLHLILPEHFFVLFSRSEVPALAWKRRIRYQSVEDPDARLYSIEMRIRSGRIQVREPVRASRPVPAPGELRYAANEDWYRKTRIVDG